jgi:hypothetical protein
MLDITLFTSWIALDGLVVSVLATGPRFTGSNPAEGDGFIMAIKIRSMTSFGGKVKPSVPFRKILRQVKETYRYENRYFVINI